MNPCLRPVLAGLAQHAVDVQYITRQYFRLEKREIRLLPSLWGNGRDVPIIPTLLCGSSTAVALAMPGRRRLELLATDNIPIFDGLLSPVPLMQRRLQHVRHYFPA